MKRKVSTRGRKRKIIKTEWNPDFAYIIGLIATDGNLSPDKRHINFTSKDKELAVLYKNILKLSNVIGKKRRGGGVEKKYYVIQFGSIQFYDFLLSIGLTPAKSKTLKKINIPDTFFWNFLRGCLDGDGNINEFSHPESSHTQLRIRFTSASKGFLVWILGTVHRLKQSIHGGWIESRSGTSVSVLTFGKSDSIKLINLMYAGQKGTFLKRKHHIAKKYIVQ